MQKVISFIIPSYNAEPYLDQCLKSFLHPDCMEQIEVLIVNDGSKDGTKALAERYMEDYPDIFRLIDKENGGHGSALKVGVKKASGRYLKVIDADDWIRTENLPVFLAYLEKSCADVVLTPFHFYDMETGKQTPQDSIPADQSIYSMEKLMQEYKKYQSGIVFHAITYRTEFYERYGIKLTEKVSYEDQEYNAVPFCHADKIASFHCFLYEYRIGNAAQSVAYKNQAARILDLEKVLRHMMAYYQRKTGLSESGRTYLLQRLSEVTLIYYAVACIYEPDKKKGRREGLRFYRGVTARIPELQRQVKKRFFLYLFLNFLSVSPERYRSWMDSAFYGKIKRMIQCKKRENNR